MLIRNISIGFGARTSGFIADIDKTASALDRMAKSSEAAQLAASKVKGGAGAPAGGASESSGGGAEVGAIGASLVGGLAPLAQMGARIETMIDRIGGTIVTLGRRIDSAIKFDATDAALVKLQSRIDTTFGEGATAAARFGLKVRGMFANFGDVAGKGLGQVTRLRTSFVQLPAPIAQATTAIRGLGVQIGLAFGLVGAVYTATRAIKSFFTMGIKGAMDLEESIDKTKQVFGAQADLVIAKATTMARAFGLPKGAIIDAAGSIGLIALGAGKGQEEAAKMANNLAQLASDASSLYNVPLDLALTKIRAGLVGEAEPLRAFGVMLSETAVKTQAQAMGLKLVKGELDEAGKVTARYALIQKGLTVASGNLAQTQTSTTNQFRKAGGGVQNFATAIGELLLPSVNLAISSFNELMSSIVETFESKKDVVVGWANNAKSAIETVVKAVRYFSDYWQVAQLSATQSVANFMAYIAVIPANLKIIGDYVANNWVKVWADALNYLDTILFNLTDNLSNLGSALSHFLAGEGFNFKWNALSDGFKATMAEFPALAKPILTDLSGQMGDIFAGIDKKEAARKAAAAPFAAASKPAIAGAAAEKDQKYAGTAAVTAGSQEAASALAKFFNKSGADDAAKKTANNTEKAVVALEKIAVSTAYLRAKETGSEVSLAIAQL